jgi:hypothetical protein
VFLGHVGQPGQGTADLQQRPAQGGERVVRGGEQQRRQLLPGGMWLQAEIGQQAPGLAAGQLDQTVTGLDPGPAEQHDAPVHTKG